DLLLASPEVTRVDIAHAAVVLELHARDEVAAVVEQAGAAKEPQVLVLVVRVLRDAALDLRLEAFELVLQPDVDHTGNGVRAPLRRGAPGHDLHAIDHERGNG